MNRQRVQRVCLALIAVLMLPTALQATFWPRSFFDEFPIGRAWIAAGGDAYNEHLVRDVGTLFLAMVIVTVWCVWRRGPYRPIAVAWLAQSALHLVYHARHLERYEGIDKIGIIGSLVVVPALAIVTLWAGWSSPETT